MSESRTDGLTDLAAEIARAAGRVLLDRWPTVRRVETKSSPTDPVSDADRAADRTIRRMLAAARPADGVLTEESGDRPGTSGLRWIVDPLDGTVNYLYSRPDWAVSIAVEDAAGPLAGAVYVPARDEMMTATRGAGAYRAGHRLRLPPPPPAALALVGTGFSYDAAHRSEQAAVLATLLPRVRDIRRAGASAADLADVATGRLDAFVEDDLEYWDLAAGALIAAQAGAEVTVHRAENNRYAVRAAKEPLHQELTGMCPF